MFYPLLPHLSWQLHLSRNSRSKSLILFLLSHSTFIFLVNCMCVCVCVCVCMYIYIYTHIIYFISIYIYIDFPGGSDCKESTYNAGDLGSIPGLGRSLGDPLGWSLEVAIHSRILGWRIPVDRGAWWTTAHGVTKSWTWLSG